MKQLLAPFKTVIDVIHVAYIFLSFAILAILCLFTSIVALVLFGKASFALMFKHFLNGLEAICEFKIRKIDEATGV